MRDHPVPMTSQTPDPLLASGPVARHMLGDISARKLAQMVAAGELETVKVGRRRLFTTAGLRAYVAARVEGGK